MDEHRVGDVDPMEKKKKEFMARLELVTPRDFFDFLNAKGVTGKCFGCGNENLQVTAISGKINLGQMLDGHGGEQFVTYFRHEPGRPADSDENYFYKSFCEYCGFITMHAVTPVLRWLDNKKNEASHADEEL